MKNNKKIKKNLNDGILKFLEAQTPSVTSQGLRYPILSNFHFWSVSIRTFYQKLWLFEVFRPKFFET